MEESRFDGRILGLFALNLFSTIFFIISLTLATPWIFCMRKRWFANRTTINGKRLIFVGTGWQFLGTFIKYTFLVLALLVILLVGVVLLTMPLKDFWFLFFTVYTIVALIVFVIVGCLWVPIKWQNWGVKHTHFYDEFE